MRTFSLLVGILAVILVLPLAAPHLETKGAMRKHREASGDRFMETQTGTTRFQSRGDSTEPVVVLIHSFNGYLESWRPNFDALTEAGYRVVSYDLFGRGLSDRPREPLNLERFREQISGLLQELDVDKPVFLVGASFGCVIAADYAQHFPARVKGLVMTGPAGWPNPADSTAQLAALPYVADLVFFYAGKFLLQSKLRDYVMRQEDRQWILAQWKLFYQHDGVARSALSTLRHSPVLDYTDGWKNLGRLKKPTLFIWGRQDSSFPYRNTEKVIRWIPHAKIVGVDNAEHWVNVDQPETVNTAILDFLKRH